MNSYTLLNRQEYFQTLAAQIAEAKRGERVMLATMSFDPRAQPVADIVSALMAAGQRGVEATLLIDAICLMIDDHGIPRPSLSLHKLQSKREPFATRQQTIEALRTAGVACHIINIPKRHIGLVQAGRSHIKGAVIGDDVFIGGCNLEQPEQIDVMVHWHHTHAASVLATWLSRIAGSEQTRDAFSDVDIKTTLDSQTDLLLDAGVPHQSLIYEEALQLIDTANEWVYLTCQFFPSGEVARRLATAQKRGVKVTIHYSHPHAHGRSAVLQHVHQLVQRGRGLPGAFFNDRLDKKLPKLHAKLLISEQAAMVGSHNYVQQGVNFGTAELALMSTDKELGKQLREFMNSQIKQV